MTHLLDFGDFTRSYHIELEVAGQAAPLRPHPLALEGMAKKCYRSDRMQKERSLAE
jgi:hypothetical protein